MKKTLLILAITAISSRMLSAAGAESTSVIIPKIARYSYEAMPKDPLASLFFSATFCGLGQLYNREYVRGVATGVTFWGSSLAIQLLYAHWRRINTDTFYVQDYFDEQTIHPVLVLKPDSLQVGLPRAEKAMLAAAITAWVGSYIFGLYDSYQGAKRFNRKLVAQRVIKPSLYYSVNTTRSEAGVRLNF
jgi:TM2 domain-containing membrane protein YozV